MKRVHINLSVNNLAESVAFYNHLFGAEPSVKKEDYAKWLLSDPMLNFSIVQANGSTGKIEHLGIQAETEDELHAIYGNIDQAKANIREEGHTVCCYAKSEKSWVMDPQGIEWEAF